MSSRASELLQDEMSALDNMNEDAINGAMARVVSIKEKLVSAGEISKTKPDDKSRAKPVKKMEKSSGNLDPEELKRFFFEVAEKARMSGLLSLEADVDNISDPIAKTGLQLVVDGTDPDIVKSIMQNTIEKELRSIQTNYEAVMEAVLSIQSGDNPQIVKQKMASRLP